MDTITEKAKKSALDGKFLTFVLSNEEYGIEILKVREIFVLMDLQQRHRLRIT